MADKYPSSDFTSCETCPNLITDCTACDFNNTHTVCTACGNGKLLAPDGLSCGECSAVINFCDSCLSDNSGVTCETCQAGFAHENSSKTVC